MANTFKQTTSEQKEKAPAASKFNFDITFDFIEDKRFRISLGAFLLVVAFNLFFSFTSFLFT